MLNRISRLLTALAFTFTCITASAADFEGWYQVDLIVFTPRSADLDDETWPESAPSYPANILAISEGDQVRPMRLSQVEQLLLSDFEIDEAQGPVDPEPDTFAFEGEGEAERNRRLIEALLRQEQGLDPAPLPELEAPDESAPDSTQDLENPIEAALATDMPDIAEAIDLDTIFAEAALTGGGHALERVGDSSLQGIARSLRRSSRFNLLGHYSWVQPINATPTPVMLQAGQRYDDLFQIEGTLSFSRGRFLHVQTALWFTEFEQRYRDTSPFAAPAFSSTLPQEVLADNQDLVKVEQQRGQYVPASRHIMQQSRRMRSAELHYLDHPLFGIVVKINRYTHTVEQ